MKIYRVKISADKWANEYNVEATGWSAAISRAIREWKSKAGKGSRSDELKIHAVKSTALLKEI